MADRRQWMKRLNCLVHGHELASADAYGEEMPDGHIEELHYCRRCGLGIWVPGTLHTGEFPEPETAHMVPDMVQPMAAPGSRQHISP